MPDLTLHEVTMQLHPNQEQMGFKYFEAGDMVHPENRPGGYYMTHEIWADMGEPTLITVRVEPGDTLTEGE